MPLTPTLRNELLEALADAYPRTEMFERMLWLELNINVQRIATGNLDDQIVDVIEWATSTGRLAELLTAAKAHNPGNPSLQALYPEELARLAAAGPLPVCPYPGLEPIQEGEAIFGRDDEVRRALDALQVFPFLPVIGPTGSGKSSFVFAGVIPAAKRDPRFVAAGIERRVMRPGADPIVQLETVVAEVSAGSRGRTLLVIDQFEEVFAPSQRLSRAAVRDRAREFAGRLQTLLMDPKWWVVFTARADFYAELMALPLWSLIKSQRFEILPLDDDGLRQAIHNPAARVGVHVHPELVERLVADAAREPGSLPLVQETLVLLWSRLHDDQMRIGQYLSLGDQSRTGLQAAIARRADAALAELSFVAGDDDGAKNRAVRVEAIVRRIFIRLVHFGEGVPDTRRQQPVSALRVTTDKPDEFDETLEFLIAKRLLTATATTTVKSDQSMGAERRIDLAHEALIAGWPTLREWLETSRGHEAIRRRLEQQAALWNQWGQGVMGLLDQGELAEAERWAGEVAVEAHGETVIAEFMAASRRAVASAAAEREATRERELDHARRLAHEQEQRAEAERLRGEEASKRATTFKRLSLALVVVLGIAAAAAFAWRQALKDAQRSSAEARRQSVASRREALLRTAQGVAPDDPTLAALLLKEMPEIDSEPPGAAALGLSVLREPLSVLIRSGRAITAAALSANAEEIALGFDNGTVEIRRSDGSGPRTMLNGHKAAVSSIVFSEDGKRLLAASHNGVVRVWNRGSEWTEEILSGHTEAVTTAAFSRDGSWALTASPIGEDSTARLWRLGSSSAPVVLRHDAGVVSASFNANGSLIVTAAVDETVKVWDLSGSIKFALAVEGEEDVRGAAFAFDDRIISLSDSKLRLWPAHGKGKPTTLAPCDASNPEAVSAFALDSRLSRVAVGCENGTVAVSTLDGASTELGFQTDTIASIEFNRDASLVLTTNGRTANIWKSDGSRFQGLRGLSGLRSLALRHSTNVIRARFSADGARIISVAEDGSARLWSAGRSPDPILVRAEAGDKTGDAVHIRYSRDGSRFVATRQSEGARVWRSDGTLESIIQGRKWKSGGFVGVGDVAINSDGTLILTEPFAGAQFVDLWRADGSLVRHLPGYRDGAFSPDGRHVLLATPTAVEVHPLDFTTKPIIFSCPTGLHVGNRPFSPNGQLILGICGGFLNVWRSDGTGAPTLLGPSRYYKFQPEISPDGTLALAVAGDDLVVVSRMDGGGDQVVLEHDDIVKSAQFSPDSKFIVTGSQNGIVTVWTVTGSDRRIFRMPQLPVAGRPWSDNVQKAVFDASSRRVMAVASDGLVVIWDLEQSHTDPILLGSTGEATFSPDGKTVVASGLSSLLLWKIDWPQIVQRIRSSASGCLSVDERRRYLGEPLNEAQRRWQHCDPEANS